MLAYSASRPPTNQLQINLLSAHRLVQVQTVRHQPGRSMLMMDKCCVGIILEDAGLAARTHRSFDFARLWFQCSTSKSCRQERGRIDGKPSVRTL